MGSVYVYALVICLIYPPVPLQKLGPSILAGVALMVLLIPINGVVAMKMRTLQVGTVTGVQLLPGAPGPVLGKGIHEPGAPRLFC